MATTFWDELGRRPLIPLRTTTFCASPLASGLSQTLLRAAELAGPAALSDFVNLWKSEADREQAVLLANRPGAGEAEPLAQPQHGLEALDGAPRCGEGLKAPDPGHVLLDPEVVALDPLLQVLGDVVDRSACQEAGFPGCSEGRRIGASCVRANPV